jgi:hypothetical protein
MVDEFISEVDAEGVVDDASEDSFPASGAPAYTNGTPDSGRGAVEDRD